MVLDLFERRLAIIESAREAAWAVAVEREVEKAHRLATDAAIRRRFLFGQDVVELLTEFQNNVFRATETGGLREVKSTDELLRTTDASAHAVLLKPDGRTIHADGSKAYPDTGRVVQRPPTAQLRRRASALALTPACLRSNLPLKGSGGFT